MARRQNRRRARRNNRNASNTHICTCNTDITTTGPGEFGSFTVANFVNIPTTVPINIISINTEFSQTDPAAHTSIQLYTDEDCVQPANATSPMRVSGLGFVARIRMFFRRPLYRLVKATDLVVKYFIEEIVTLMHATFKCVFQIARNFIPIATLPVTELELYRSYIRSLVPLLSDPAISEFIVRRGIDSTVYGYSLPLNNEIPNNGVVSCPYYSLDPQPVNVLAETLSTCSTTGGQTDDEGTPFGDDLSDVNDDNIEIDK